MTHVYAIAKESTDDLTWGDWLVDLEHGLYATRESAQELIDLDRTRRQHTLDLRHQTVLDRWLMQKREHDALHAAGLRPKDSSTWVEPVRPLLGPDTMRVVRLEVQP